MDVYTKCSNYATETCPCILAERGKCIQCSMCHGEDYCSCSDTVSYCILQELTNGGGRARPHHSMRCEVRFVKEYEDDLIFIRVNVPNVQDFIKLGAYVFVRVDDDPFFDVPISVLFEDYNSGTIGLLIHARGIKTESFRSISKGNQIYVRGPYYNGVQGRSTVGHLHNSRAVVVCRGIGFIPSLHVIGALRESGNAVDVYIDHGEFSRHVSDLFKELQEVRTNEVKICDQNGELTEDFDRIVTNAVNEGVELIHLGLSDYMLKKAIGSIEQKDPHHRMAISCINNAHICCGEGICGACTKDKGPSRTVHLCKEQLNIYEYKELL